jgi:hypothetical protein
MPRLSPVAPAAPQAEAAALRKAAEGFEALLIEKLLAAAHPDLSGPEADSRALAEREVATQIAAGSPLGLARLLETRK